MTRGKIEDRPPTETDKSRFWSHVKKGAADACWPWQGRVADDRPAYTRTQGATRPALIAHLLAGGESGDGWRLRHTCARPDVCCNPAHLVADPVDLHRRARLTVPQVEEIDRALRSGESQTRIAERYGVGRMSISNIARGFTWRQVTGRKLHVRASRRPRGGILPRRLSSALAKASEAVSRAGAARLDEATREAMLVRIDALRAAVAAIPIDG